jgi:uncharacterized protein YggE
MLALATARKHRVGVAVFAAFLVSAYLWAQSARMPMSASLASRSISVSGEAVVYVVPDQAIVRFGIESFDPALQGATDANDASSRRLLKVLRAAEIAERDIQAEHEGVEIKYSSSNQKPPGTIDGYVVRRAYSVTLRDVSRLDELLRVILRSGVNHVDGYELRTTELRKYRDDVRKKAIRAAHEKAQALAGELGCAVGLPTSIGEGYYGWLGTYGYWGYGSWGHWGGSGYNQGQAQNVNYSVAGASGSGDEPSGTPVGQIGVRAQVSVVFELAAK